MKRTGLSSEKGRRALRALGAVAAAALTTLACDNSMTFKAPTFPDWPDGPFSPPGLRTVQIHGVLEVADGTCLEATVLYDGRELAGARARCPEPSGCAQLELGATVRSEAGHHTISFQVLDQSRERVDYIAAGSVLVSREGLSLGGAAMPLGPAHARLEAGGAVDFEVVFTD